MMSIAARYEGANLCFLAAQTGKDWLSYHPLFKVLWYTMCMSGTCDPGKYGFVETKHKNTKMEETKMNEKAIILEAMKKAGEPLNAGKVAELTGLDRKVVDKAFAEMKKDGSIVSPVRCKWEPAEK